MVAYDDEGKEPWGSEIVYLGSTTVMMTYFGVFRLLLPVVLPAANSILKRLLQLTMNIWLHFWQLCCTTTVSATTKVSPLLVHLVYLCTLLFV